MIAILGWGLSTIFIEQGLKTITPFNFLFLRFVISFIMMSFFVFIKFRSTVKIMIKSKWVWIIGLSESAGLCFQYLGQKQDVSAGLAALLSLNFLIIVPFLSPFLLNVRIRKQHILAVIIGFLGVILIGSEGRVENIQDNSIVGIGLLTLAAFCYALYIVSTSRYTTIENTSSNAYVLFYLVSFIISLTSMFLTIIYEDINLPSHRSSWLWIFNLVVFSTILAFIGYFEALKGISANKASVLLLLQITIPFVVEFVLGKKYDIWIWVGIGLIVTSMIIVIVSDSD